MTRHEPDLDPPDGDNHDAAAEPRADADEILGENPDDEALPATRRRRRAAGAAAILFIVLILTFLIWFIASNTERSEPRGFFGERDGGGAEVGSGPRV